MKKLYITVSLLATLALAGCWTPAVELPATTETVFSLGETYTIWSETSTQKDVYGVIMGDNLRNIFSTIGGFATQVDCQPGKKVSANDLIAEVIPNQNDPAIKNLYIQQLSLKQQIENIDRTYEMTEQNFEIQKESLEAQTENNQDIYNQDSADLTKLERSIQNFKSQQINTINDSFKKIRTSGGNTDNSDLYDELYDQRNDIQDLSNEDFSQYLEDMAELNKKAAKYASGDTLYSMFMWLSNGFRASKSAFDTLTDGYTSAENAYDNQHNTLGTNLNLVDKQIQSIENNKQIQINTLNSQKASLQQMLDSLSNSLETEYIYAWVDGIIKAKLIWEDNKVGPNTMICQIVPNNSTNKKLQLYSANKLDIGQEIKIVNKDKVLAVKKIEYELPYKDSLTQNYIYEVTNLQFDIYEGDKINIQFSKKLDSKEVWIPISFIFSKLDGNYIRIKTGTWFAETKVEIWDINNKLVKITSGASLGQTIIN
jgi:hypothetical protein